MQTELLELIKKSLPSMQVDALKVELDKAARVAGLESKIIQLEKDLRETQTKYSESLKHNSEISKGLAAQKDLEERERNLKITLLEKEISLNANSKREFFELMGTVFRNPKFVHKEEIPMVVKSSPGYEYVSSETKTKTVEQE